MCKALRIRDFGSPLRSTGANFISRILYNKFYSVNKHAFNLRNLATNNFYYLFFLVSNIKRFVESPLEDFRIRMGYGIS